MIKFISILITFSLSISIVSQIQAATIGDQRVVWRRIPISVTLPIGHERYVTFPTRVQLGYDISQLPPSILRVENNNGTLYLTAKHAFPAQRVQVKLENGEIILMDLRADKNGEQQPMDVLLPKTISQPGVTGADQHSIKLNYSGLMRYAIQQLYAPKSFLKQVSSITRFPMNTLHLVPLFYDNSAIAMPLASWRRGHYYLTVVLIKNVLPQRLVLNPRDLCGHWKAVSFYPKTTLASKESAVNQDSTSVFLISDVPFSEAIHSCLITSIDANSLAQNMPFL